MKSYSHATDLRRAISLLESGRIAEAEAIAQLALKQDRKNALVYALLAKIADTKGQLDAAAKHYEKSIRLDSKQVMTHIALGQLRTNQGRYKQAIASIKKLCVSIRTIPTPSPPWPMLMTRGANPSRLLNSFIPLFKAIRKRLRWPSYLQP